MSVIIGKSVPTLEYMSMLQVVRQLLPHENDVKVVVTRNMSCREALYIWDKRLNDAVSKLLLPRKLHAEVFDKTWQVIFFGTQLNLSHEKLPVTCERCPCMKEVWKACVLWLTRGFPRKIETIENLVINPNLSVAFRFMIACDYLDRESILDLWNQLPESVKFCFSDANLDHHINYTIRNVNLFEDSDELQFYDS